MTGPGAAAYLQRLCANDVDRAVGTVTYTQMLNSRGGIECDFTVTRLGERRFRIVTGTAFGNHDLGWIRGHMPTDGSVEVADVTSAYACFGLWGPRARDILQPLTTSDSGTPACPTCAPPRSRWATCPVLAVRVTYVGELGWELYCPPSTAQRSGHDLGVGPGHGMLAAGYRAIDALRVEKGYRVWGADITPEDSSDEAGLGFAVKPDKGVEFIGRDALLRAREAAPGRRLCCLALGRPRRGHARIGAGAGRRRRSSGG